MKKSILILATAIFLIGGTAVLSSCGNDENAENQEHMMNSDDNEHMMNSEDADVHEHSGADVDTVYACPMHHNITGKKGDTCSICGMKLTNTETAKEHQGHTHMHNN